MTGVAEGVILSANSDLFNKAPPEVTIWADTGFQGIDKQHPNTQIPKKGTRKRPLSPEQKQENKIISGIRITVEHAIGPIPSRNATKR
ncbi:transposase family protein [Symbiopectobacterium purcellii]|uniref:transposase family protein n=1 Tax=Symbiopectobacterium purcellii TaxID=2871826 RepID=UPI003F851C7F